MVGRSRRAVETQPKLGCCYAAPALNGFTTLTPKGLKLAVLRVTTVKPCSLAVAAIMASS